MNSPAQNDQDPKTCCQQMREALAGGFGAAAGVYNPTFFPGADGRMMVAIGYLPIRDDVDPKKWIDISWLDYEVRFCPFCGTELGTRN